jgi:hypothetical protein
MGIREEMVDPKIDMFRNLLWMTVDKIERFDPKLGGIVEEIDGGLVRNINAEDGCANRTKKKRKDYIENCYRYKIGRYELSTYYRQFLSVKIICTPCGSLCSVWVMTEHISRNPRSIFPCWFCMPLCKVGEIADRFISEGWLSLLHHCHYLEKLQVKAELLVMGALAMIAETVQNFQQLWTVTHICARDHSKFFLTIVKKMASISHEYVYFPRFPEELAETMKHYEQVGLPGPMGSVDVVHVKWSNCHAGDFNRSKGKESYPSLKFDCITDIDCHILGVFGPQFGSQNKKHIVKIDPNVQSLSEGWLSEVEWQYYDEDGTIKKLTGVYLIWDNAYICWLITICPYMHLQTNNRLEDFFSTNIKSELKNVECVFGILKLHWSSLDKGFKYR